MIDVVCQITQLNVDYCMIALFVDDTENALAVAFTTSAYGAGGEYGGLRSASQPLTIKYFVASGSTTQRTYKVRFGGYHTQHVYINGLSTRLFGGVSSSSITITEIYNG